MGTSTGDIAHGTERPESGPGELIVSTENNNNEGGETTTTALQNGTFIF
jgi:hydrogenase maturation factor HypE